MENYNSKRAVSTIDSIHSAVMHLYDLHTNDFISADETKQIKEMVKKLDLMRTRQMTIIENNKEEK